MVKNKIVISLIFILSIFVFGCNKQDSTELNTSQFELIEEKKELLDEKEVFLKEKEESLKELEAKLDELEAELAELEEKEQKSEQIYEPIKNDNSVNNDGEMIHQEVPSVAENYNEEDIIEGYDIPNHNYGIRNVSIYEGVANYAPDMYYPITVDIKIYITPIGQNSVERIGGTYTVDYGTTVLEALHAAFGVGVEDGKITEIGGIKASDLGYEEFYAEWTSVYRVTEVNMSGYILQPDDSIAIYKK